MFAFLAGWRIYAVLAIGLALAGLGAWGAWQQKKAEIAEARAADALGQRDRAIAAAQANAEAAQKLSALNEALNLAVVERDKRARALERAKQALKDELEIVYASLPEADKACLDRSLPKPLADRLRDPGPSHPD